MPSNSNQPSLAPELWLRIFEMATWIPGALETSDPDAISAFFRDPHGITAQGRFCKSIELKLSLSLVCKHWYRLVTRSLFEYIVIKSGRQALKVASVLENKVLWSGDHGPGWWTIRLEVSLEGVHHWGNKYCNALSRILNDCPNLQVLSTGFCSFDSCTFPKSAFVSALTSKPLGLRRLEIKGDLSVINAILSVFCSSLQVLWLLVPCACTWEAHTSIYFDLPKLHTFNCAFALPPYTSAWRMPSLKTLQIETSTGWEPYLKRHGRQLERVSLPVPVPLLVLLSLSPSLESFTIDIHKLLEKPLTEVVSQVHTRSIYIECGGVAAYQRRSIMPSLGDGFEVLVSNLLLLSHEVCPSLEYIRFFLPCQRPVSYIPLGFLETWKPWLSQCDARGISVQGSQGLEDQTAGLWTRFNPCNLL